MVSTLTLSAQITGKVVDSKTGNELIGANVYLEGNTRGTSTNVSGEFTLDEEATGNVVVSFLGYETLTIPAQNDMGTISITTTAQIWLHYPNYPLEDSQCARHYLSSGAS